MQLSKLLSNSQVDILERGGNGDPEITDIRYDSRLITLGALYVAIPGTVKHGDSFISDALKNGAAAVISENAHPELDIPWIRVRDIRKIPGLLGQCLWNVDIRAVIFVAVTGTNGKTTVTHLFETLYRKKFGIDAVWMFGTIDYHIGSQVRPSTHTTPEALDIFRFAGEVNQVPSVISMEVSSHSLALNRVGGMMFDLAVWTNLTQDHLDFHKNMDSYYIAKRRLFMEYLKHTGKAIVNIDDPWGRKLIRDLKGVSFVTYGKSEDADVRFVNWDCSWDGTGVDIIYLRESFTIRSRLCGFFNVYNMTAMTAGALAAGFSIDEIKCTLQEITTVNGRMDRVDFDAPFAVIVDYAHTPDALVNVLNTARTLTSGKLICVFGCGGDRDRTKRPLMGAVVAEHADDGIVTSDNPRSEKPGAIIEEILSGIPLDFPHRPIADRRLAIRCALQTAQAGDCIVIAGKGHETYQEVKGVKSHFDDREVAVQEYAQLKKEQK